MLTNTDLARINNNDLMFRVRMNKETRNKLDAISKKMGTSRSQVVRDCINDKYQEVIEHL